MSLMKTRILKSKGQRNLKRKILSNLTKFETIVAAKKGEIERRIMITIGGDVIRDLAHL